MTPDDVAKDLHDRATRGAVLSAEDQALLETWYARQDQREGATLGKGSGAPTPAVLQAQVDSILAQLLAVTQRIQKLTADCSWPMERFTRSRRPGNSR